MSCDPSDVRQLFGHDPGFEAVEAENIAAGGARLWAMDDLEAAAERSPRRRVGRSEQDAAPGPDDGGKMGDSGVVAEVGIGTLEQGCDLRQAQAFRARGVRQRWAAGFGWTANFDDAPFATDDATPVGNRMGEAGPVLANRAATRVDDEQRSAAETVQGNERGEPVAIDHQMRSHGGRGLRRVDAQRFGAGCEAAVEVGCRVFAATHPAKGINLDAPFGGRELCQSTAKSGIARPGPRKAVVEPAEQSDGRGVERVAAAEEVGDLAALQGKARGGRHLQEFQPIAVGGDGDVAVRRRAARGERRQQAEEVSKRSGEEHQGFNLLAATRALHYSSMPLMNVAASCIDLIGQTPAIRLHRVPGAGAGEVWGKLESLNPGGSVKDRICLAMIEAAERDGRLAPGGTIIEPTSGNTGIGLALVAAVKGYRLTLTMPNTMSQERRSLLLAYGADLVLTEGELGMHEAIERAEELLAETPEAFMPQQFDNPANPQSHRETTAREILEAFERIDAFVAGVGTGGTITGVGEVLRRERPGVRIVAVEPESSPVLSGGEPGFHRIQGIGAGFRPGILAEGAYDEVVVVSDADAADYTRRLAAEEGILAGISAGANVCAATRIARELGPEAVVVTVICDTGQRYLTTELFGEEQGI